MSLKALQGWPRLTKAGQTCPRPATARRSRLAKAVGARAALKCESLKNRGLRLQTWWPLCFPSTQVSIGATSVFHWGPSVLIRCSFGSPRVFQWCYLDCPSVLPRFFHRCCIGFQSLFPQFFIDLSSVGVPSVIHLCSPNFQLALWTNPQN